MAMAEEPQLQSIQARIAALNHAQIGRNPSGAPASQRPQPPPPPSRPMVVRNKTVNNPPHEANGSVVDRTTIGNEPAGLRQDGLLPPPVITRTGQKTDKRTGAAKAPPLPTRRSQARSPALPPRRPSGQLDRRDSLESTTSAASYSTTSTSTGRTAAASSTSLESGGPRVRAPAWGEAELPPLPPKRTEAEKAKLPSLPSRPKPKHSVSVGTGRKIPPESATSPPLPPPRLPPRRESNDDSGENKLPAPRLPPRRPSGGRDSWSVNPDEENGIRPPPRRLPPPAPSAAAIEKIRLSSFAGLNKHAEEPKIPPRPASVSNGAPPPVPLASRPDLSKIQATKPRFNPSAVSTVRSTVCLRCRDFSGPDTHAARYPRQSLPTQDLAWLANELTAPFPSPTDKARALFTWLHYNISYDVDAFFNNCVRSSTPASTLATGLAVCEGYAGLFAALATYAGLEAIVIGGHGKGFGYQNLAPGSSLPPFQSSHAWNAVKIDDGKWKLIDPCWGAGAVQGKGMPYIQRLEDREFTMSNDEFGLRHFPANKDQFFRDDGRIISWEEYLLGNPNSPFGIQQPEIFGGAKENSIGERSFLPAAKQISVYQPGPLRFQFSLICEHWSITRHSKKRGPYVFLLIIHGIDGRNEERLPFEHVRGSGPEGGGDFWYLDIADPRTLGAPGQKLQLAAVTSFGDWKDARGLSVQEYREKHNRVGMGWSFIAQWQLIA